MSPKMLDNIDRQPAGTYFCYSGNLASSILSRDTSRCAQRTIMGCLEKMNIRIYYYIYYINIIYFIMHH
jgi:hypothetical protein